MEKKLEDIRTGTQGIVMNFLPNAPPDKLHVDYDADNSFDVILELRNKGAYPQPLDRITAPKGTVFLSGYDTNIITFGGNNAQYIDGKALEGKSTINPNGGLDLSTFKGNVDVNNLNVEKYEPTLLATACYYYETVAGPSVCIDPNPYSITKERKVCTVQSITLSNQGAPIAVTRVDEEALAARTQFKITIKNVGGGDVLKKEVVGEKCEPSELKKIEREDIDKVYVWFVKISNEPLICGPFSDIKDGQTKSSEGGVVRLINGEGFVICELPKSQYKNIDFAYTTPLLIHLGYTYRTTTEKKIQIKKEITSTSGGGGPTPTFDPATG